MFSFIKNLVQNIFCKFLTMEEDIALNDTLKENLFVTIICILNRVPVFLVGKPGTSKSITFVLFSPFFDFQKTLLTPHLSTECKSLHQTCMVNSPLSGFGPNSLQFIFSRINAPLCLILTPFNINLIWRFGFRFAKRLWRRFFFFFLSLFSCFFFVAKFFKYNYRAIA